MTTAKELHQERALVLAAIKNANWGSEKARALINFHEFDKRWAAHWAELDRAAADLPPSLRID